MHYSPNLHWVLNMQLHHNINAAEMICYIFFLNHCNDGECQLYMDTIAEGLGVSKRQAARYINKLIRAGLIERERPKRRHYDRAGSQRMQRLKSAGIKGIKDLKKR